MPLSVRLSTVLSHKSIYFKVILDIKIMLRYYGSVELSDEVTYTEVIKPSFAASPGAGCNHMLNAGQKMCHTETQDIHTGTGTHTSGWKSCVFVVSNECI